MPRGPAASAGGLMIAASLVGGVLVGVLVAAAPRQDAVPRQSGPETMRAVRIHAFGSEDVLRLEDVPRPVAGPGEVLVRVRAAGVNPVDVGVRSGRFGDNAARLPFVLGFDLAGTAEAVGPGVTSIAPGEDVYAMLDLARSGAYAEFAIARATEVARMPRGLTYEQAAGVPLVALTAHQALFDTAHLQAGQTVLIQGGSGGVGSYAIQIAKAAGARVVAVASGRNQAYMRALGADVTVDYETQRFEDVVREVDVVLDMVGGETQQRSFAVLERGGHLVSLLGAPSRELAARHGVSATGILLRPSGGQLAEIAARFERGRLRAGETTAMPLADVRAAHEAVASRHTRGKIVLVP